MFQDSADEKERHFAQARVTISGEQWFTIFPKRNVGVHTGTVIGEERFRHERGRFVVLPRDVANDVFVILHRVAHHFQRRETDIDLGLAGSGHFVVLFIDWDACFLELKRHFVADILQRIHRRNREITFLRPNLVTDIRKFFARAVPMAFDTVHEMERRIARVTEAHVVEDKKLRFRPEECRVGDAGALQISFCFFGDTARVAIVRFARDRIDNGANQTQASVRR